MSRKIATHLAVLVDAGGRFVSVIRVPGDTKRIVGHPFTRHDKASNERMGLIADRLPQVNSTKAFGLRGHHPMQGEEPCLIFKEETS